MVNTVFDVAVIGCGRVGLPLILAFDAAGKKCVAVDTNEDILSAIENKVMPFDEHGCQQLLDSSNIAAFRPTEDIKMPHAKYYILTVGTPVMQHIETDLKYVENAVSTLIGSNVLNSDSTLILRSTLAPGTTEHIKNMLDRNKVKCSVAMCPERLAEGKAIEELRSLPQLIGGIDEESTKRAYDLFSCLTDVEPLILDSPQEAELAKLFCNIFRYINFAIPNYFLYLMNEFNVKNPFSFLDKIKHEYPRMDSLAKPGFAAGTCLRKDYGMINECFPHTDLLMQAYKINEFMPKFITEQAGNIKDHEVVILGYTFKKDTDDVRDSLVPKLIRYINRKDPLSVSIVEPNLPVGLFEDKFSNFEFDNVDLGVLNESTMNGLLEKVPNGKFTVFVATNHSAFENNEDLKQFLSKPNVNVVDIWNMKLA